MQKLEGRTFNVVQDNITKLKELFPEIITEDKIDIDKLRIALGENVEKEKERYEFSWKGKTEAIQLAQKQTTGTLRPCKEESENWDTTENLYLEGDNLEVLRILQNSYRNKVKMIYIDPPYNTGKDFVYQDDFRNNVKSYKEKLEENMKSNVETNGRFHTDWLNMIYPRLKIAKNLLAENGTVFISIDDMEHSNLKKVCDEIFGEDNFVANFVWQKKYGPANDSNSVSDTHEHILCYAKSKSTWSPGLLPRNEKQLAAFSNPDSDPRGRWRASDLSVRTYSQSGDYPITGPHGDIYYPPASRAWVVNETTFKQLLSDNRITFGKDGKGRPMVKKFLSEVKQGITPETWISREKGDDNKGARLKLKELMPENVFDTPKPTKLIKHLMKISDLKNNDIVLDFFAGSSTTAHSVMMLNSEDKGNRRFIMVQLPEPTNEKSVARKEGFENICQIGKERIRRAKQVLIEDAKDKEGLENIDFGFKVFKLDETNLRLWDEESIDLERDLIDLIDPVKEGRSQEDVVYEVLLKYGIDLTVPIETFNVAGKVVFSVGMGYLQICLERDLTLKHIEEMAKQKPARIVFYDEGFKDDTVRTNAQQILKRYGVEDIRVI